MNNRGHVEETPSDIQAGTEKDTDRWIHGSTRTDHHGWVGVGMLYASAAPVTGRPDLDEKDLEVRVAVLNENDLLFHLQLRQV
jgi:hypothetical protein